MSGSKGQNGEPFACGASATIVATKTRPNTNMLIHQRWKNFQGKMNTVVPHQKTIVQVGQLYVVTETGQTMFCHLIDQQMQM